MQKIVSQPETTGSQTAIITTETTKALQHTTKSCLKEHIKIGQHYSFRIQNSFQSTRYKMKGKAYIQDFHVSYKFSQ